MTSERIETATQGTVLVLNYDGENDYASYLPEYAGRIVVLSQEPLERSDGLLEYEHIEDMESVGLPDVRIPDLHARYGFTRIITDNEYEIIRAAAWRERLGLPGQGLVSARAFRDKVFMKDCARSAVPVPPYQRIEDIADLPAAVARIGLPAVLKPVDQGGARSIVLLRTPADVEEACRTRWKYAMELEAYIEGEHFHVDAVIADDVEFVSCAAYYNSPLDYQNGLNLGCVLTHPDDELTTRLTAFLRRTLVALPAPAASAYHLEVIRDTDNQLWLCEIACRVGGGQIPELVRLTYGLDLNREAARVGCDLAPSTVGTFTGTLHASLMIRAKGGRLVAADPEPPFDWVVRYTLRYPVGAVLAPPAKSTDYVACVVVRGETEKQLVQRLQTMTQWAEQTLIWDAEVSDAA